MEVAAFSAILSNFVLKLWDVIRDENKQRFDLQQDITFITDELPTMAARILEHEYKCRSTSCGEANRVIQGARRWAQDTEDCIGHYLSYQAPRIRRGEFAAKVKVLRERLSGITGEISSLPQGTSSSKEPQDPDFDGVLVGMDIKELRDLLEPVGESKGKLKIISIVGFGGSGKTRLANEVRKAVRQQFPEQILVRVADRNVDEVLKQLLVMVADRKGTSAGVQRLNSGADTSVDNQHVNNGADTSVDNQHVNNGADSSIDSGASTFSDFERLKSCLGKQRYLIVFDDVRKKKDWVIEWEALEKVFPDTDIGSRIIVTTTSESVAALCSAPNGHVYKMSTLNFEDSEKLFRDALSKGIAITSKEDLEPLVKRCDGLPIALIGWAKSLAVNRTLDSEKCRQALHHLCAPKDSNSGALRRMQWVLMNKYNGLFKKTGHPPKASYGARACLLYFHMFQFGTPIKRKFLIRRWLDEELVHRDESQSSDLDAASEHWNTLVDGNIIRPMEVSNNALTVKSCRLPGTMHAFISGQSKSQDFVTFLCPENSERAVEPRYVRRLSLRGGTANSDSCIKEVPVYLLRTLAVSGEACEAVVDFSKYMLMRVLDLKEWVWNKNKVTDDVVQEKLIAICKLAMLKYLGLPGCIGSVPKEILNLNVLETLDVGGAEIVRVYGEVLKHPTLKHLLGKFRLSAGVSYSKNLIPKDSKLETISGFVTSKKAVFPKFIKHMGELKKVKMWCDSNTEGKELKADVSAAIQGFILKGDTKPGDRSLSIVVTGCKLLDSLKAAGKLTKLKLHGRLDKVPEFITQATLKVTSLCLSLTTLCGSPSLFPFELKPAGATLLPSLRYLKLVEDDLGPLKIQEKHFPSLLTICLVGNNSINSITVEAGALRCLFSLHVICEHLDGLAGIEIEGLKELKEIALHSKVSQTTDDVHPEIKSTKDIWKDAARRHPNKPQVLLIEAAP